MQGPICGHYSSHPLGHYLCQVWDPYNTIQYICMFIQGTTKHHKKKLVLLVSLLLKVLAEIIIIIKKSPLFNHLNTKNKYLTSNKYFITKDLTST